MPPTFNTDKVSDLIFDIGLHHGQDTDFYLKKGFRVVAFEADPDNAEFCRHRFAKEMADGRLTIVEGAIAEDSAAGEVKFYRNPDHSLWGSTSEDWAVRNEVLGTRNHVIRVEAVDFAEQVRKFGVPYYLKADIVGSETIVLRALLDFQEKPEYLSIRSEKLVWRKLEFEFDLLNKLGYASFKVVKQDFEKIRGRVAGDNGRPSYEFEEGGSGPFGEESPGDWHTRAEALRDYRPVFIKYWLFGDYSYLVQTDLGRRLIARTENIIKRSIPGWYDTHARHASVLEKK